MIKQPVIFFIYVVAFGVHSQASHTDTHIENPIENHVETRTQAHTQSKDALLNERFSVDRNLLEKHWGINCDHAVESTLTWLSEQKDNDNKLWDRLTWKDLNYCGLLFNTVNTGRHEPCPDYFKAYQLLSKMRQGTIHFDHQLIKRTLSNQCAEEK